MGNRIVMAGWLISCLMVSASAARAVVPAHRVGDVNGDGDVTLADATLSLRLMQGTITLPPEQVEIASQDGKKPNRQTVRRLIRAALGMGSLPWVLPGGFGEGPVALPDGRLIYLESYSKDGNIIEVKPDGTAKKFVSTGGRPGGARLLDNGHLLVSDFYKGILDIAPDGTIVTIANKFEGKAIGGANDLVLGPSGRVYFTASSSGEVFLLTPDGQLTRLAKGISFPNGIALTRDNALLIGEMNNNRIVKLPLDENGLPKEKRPVVWAKGVASPDGILLDAAGNLWVTSNSTASVHVFDPAGKKVRFFTTGGQQPTNLIFGLAGSRTIYLTVYSWDISIGGLHLLKLPPHDPLASALP